MIELALLTGAAFVAGLVDSIAGGGGIISLPALLATGLPASVALGTNKGQSVFGSGASLIEFGRKGAVDLRRAPFSFVFAALGALLGARAVLLIDPLILRPIVLVLLVVASGAAFLRKREPDQANEVAPQAKPVLASGVAFLIGTYDGFFGPGTGTFLVLAYAYLFRDPLVKASANAKVANFASNLASFVLFAAAGVIRWEWAIPMGIAQVAGAAIGTRLTLKKGAGLVRGAAVVVSLLLAGRILWQILKGQ